MRARLRTCEPFFITLFRVFDAFTAGGLFFLSMFLFQNHSLFVFEASVVVFLMSMIAFEYGNAYVSWRFSPIKDEIKRLVGNSLLLCILITILGLFLNYGHYYLSAIPFFVVIFPITLVASRIVVWSILKSYIGRSKNVRKAIIVGTGQMGSRLAKWITNNPWSGTQIVGFFNGTKGMFEGYPVMGSYDDLPEYIQNHKVDIVYIALSTDHSPKLKAILHELVDSTISVQYVPDVYTHEYLLKHSYVDYIDNFPIISVVDSPIRGINVCLKRMEDIVVSSLILILISPIMLLIALVIKLTSKGPILFKQWRYGLHGLPIHIWKFRTMTVCEDGYVMQPAIDNDQRITRVGKFLRKFSLDEFPQFFNVLLGSMSVVGPRPHAVIQVEQYRKQVNGSMLRHIIKPGISGLAQLYATRCEVDTLDKLLKRVEYDLEYLHHWSLWVDFKIILLTVFDLFKKHSKANDEQTVNQPSFIKKSSLSELLLEESRPI